MKEKRGIRFSNHDMLQGPMAKVLKATKLLWRNRELPPSYEDISKLSGVSSMVVPDYIRMLEKKGFLRPRYKKSSS